MLFFAWEVWGGEGNKVPWHAVDVAMLDVLGGGWGGGNNNVPWHA